MLTERGNETRDEPVWENDWNRDRYPRHAPQAIRGRRTEKAEIEHRWDEMVNDPEFKGRGGSPFETMDERLQEIENELEKK
jgi:hypothetical protein